MRHPIIVFLCLLAGASTGLAQTSESQPDPRLPEIQKVIALLDQSVVKRDEAIGKTLLHNEFTFVNPGGFVMNKERFIKFAFGGNTVFEEHKTEELSVRFFGEVAACRGLLKFRANTDGQARDFQARITVVIVKEKGQWQVFTYHSSTLPPPRPAQPSSPPPAPIKPPSEL